MGEQMIDLKKIFRNLVFVAAILPASTALAQQSITAEVNEKCANELKTYCKGVTLGDGRVAACLYAYEDKLSAQCTLAVYRGVEDFWIANENLKVYAKVCSADLVQYCSTVPAGGGRLFSCIKKNKATLTDACRAALSKAEPDMKRLGLIP